MTKYIKTLFKIFLLKLAVQLVYSFKVNVKENPEFLSKDGKVCDRNCHIGETALQLNFFIRYLETNEN